MSSLIVHSDSYLAMDLQKFCDPATADNDATVSMRETQAILNTTEGWSVAVGGAPSMQHAADVHFLCWDESRVVSRAHKKRVPSQYASKKRAPGSHDAARARPLRARRERAGRRARG